MINQSSLRFYRYLERAHWLRSYRRKFLFVAFVGTHVPLLALIAYLTQTQGAITPSTVFWVALTATLAGTFGVLWALRLLLQPILLAGEALNSYLTNGEVLPLPSDLHDEAGIMMRDVGSAIRTFTENRQRLEQYAETDFLTGLLNRRGADERLRKCLEARRTEGKPLYVALLDIDHFKRLNDSFGHELGDIALRNLGQYLGETLPKSGAWAARWGGEEFLLVWQGMAPETETPEYVRESLDLIRKQIPTASLENKEVLKLTASIGLTEACPGEAAETVLARADVALYIAKQNGRDQTCSMNLTRRNRRRKTDHIWLSSEESFYEGQERRKGMGIVSEEP
jgi:diguanylate cyclase (GGDEF)-like protein